MNELIKFGKESLGCPVEFEFAVNLYDDSKKKTTADFCVLQMKPMLIEGLIKNTNQLIEESDNILFKTPLAMGDGMISSPFKVGDDVRSSPAIGSDGTVYVGSLDKKLYAIKTDSKGLAKSPWPMRGQNAQHTGRALKK